MMTVVAAGFLYLIAVGLCLAISGATRARSDQATTLRVVGSGPDALRGVVLSVEHCKHFEDIPVYFEDTREVA